MSRPTGGHTGRGRQTSQSPPPRGRSQNRSRSPTRRPTGRRPSPPPYIKTSKRRLQKYGKSYARYGCAIVPPGKVIEHYLLRLHNEADAIEATYSEDDDYVYAQWDALLLRCPPIMQEVTHGSEDRIETVKQDLDSAWSLARSDAVQSVGKVIRKWISRTKVDGISIIPPDTTNPADVDEDSKAALGFVNPTTARLLCPYSLDINAPGVRESLEACEVEKDDLPLLFFEDYRVAENSPEVLCGALQSDITYWGYQTIFTSPSSAGKPGRTRRKRSSKPTNCEIAGMSEVTGPSIGFTCLVLRFLLSPSKNFYLVDDEFDYRALYKQIVDFIDKECAMPVVAPETLNDGQRFLKKWNERIFGKQHVVRPEASISTLVERARARVALGDITN
ncbi:hypothetical protein EXIGLDRAFT_697183 [Exidia glandulosa HHB12029]|uniref:Uncharacterized protein n=1 Tax=Exidia glandulosa HHB12029 TaxID=1314781 RepID=A0A165EWK2_EXIGL|nr:hypothetical protein EXIGLDRAFT_697183 [Exidia glandulosa HHB12029]